MKISFLIAAHNEEKIIRICLNNLLKLPYKDYEVIVGLDGCTDKTLNIVKEFERKSKKFKHIELNLREGKPAVINELIKIARGEIIIINDADWIFKVKNNDSLVDFLSVFKDSKVGGIAESFPMEWNQNMKRSNFVYKMVAYSTYFWLEFQKEKYSKKIDGKRYVIEPKLFMTNIFRKKLYSKNSSLGDDFERTSFILEKGYKIITFQKEDLPRMNAVYSKIEFKDFYRQKVRTAKAREQIRKEGKGVSIYYYLFCNLFIISQGFKKGYRIGASMILWIILTSIATLQAKLKDFDTKEGWKLRARR